MPTTTPEVDVHGTPPSEPPPCSRTACSGRDTPGHNYVWRFGEWQCPYVARAFCCELGGGSHNSRPAYLASAGSYICDECAPQAATLMCEADGCDEGLLTSPRGFFLNRDGTEVWCYRHHNRCRYCGERGAERLRPTMAVYVCTDCHHRLPLFCAICGDAAENYRQDRGDGVIAVCDDPSCDAECDYCGDVVGDEGLNADNACETCEEGAWTCESCGVTRYAEEPHYWNGYDHCSECIVYCDVCGEDHPPPECSDVIQHFDYTPEPLVFHPDDLPTPGKLYIGFELEAEAEHGGPGNAAEAVLAAAGGYDNPYLYLKEDGSLMAGFEMVSHPLDPEWALAEDTDFPWHAIRVAADEGMRSYDRGSCGLHMHLSRDAFIESHLWKFLQFHYRNPRAMQAIAMRRSTGYAKWDDDERRNVLKYVKKYDRNHDRYVAVNLQNPETIELRYWKGTLKVESVQRAIKLAYGIYLYTRDMTYKEVVDGGLKFGAFRKWATKRWPDLFDFMQRRTRDVQDVVDTRPAWPPPPQDNGTWWVGDTGFLDLNTRRGDMGIDRDEHGRSFTVVREANVYGEVTIRTGHRSVWVAHPDMLRRRLVTSQRRACSYCEACCDVCIRECADGHCAN